MAVLQSDKLKWYHPLNTKTDSNGLLWSVATNPFNMVDIEGFVAGQVGNAIESVVTPPHSILSRPVADYPSLDGSSDVTVAMWLNPPSSGAYDFLCGWMDVANVRFQQIGIESSATALSLRNGIAGNPEVQFNGLVSVSRNVWSLVMLNLHHDGSDWEARKSINGAPWSAPVAPSTGSAPARLPFTGTSEFAFVHLVMAVAGGLIDEVAIWDDATLFTDQEISNMYDLGNVLGEGFDQYTNQFTNFFDISSDPSGVAIAVSPNDDIGNGDGTTPFARNYASSTDVTLTAPATSENRCFAGWRNSVGDTLSLSRSFTLNVSGEGSVTAHYEYTGDSRDDHSVASP